MAEPNIQEPAPAVESVSPDLEVEGVMARKTDRQEEKRHGSADIDRQISNISFDEPQLEYDNETGLELAAQAELRLEEEELNKEENRTGAITPDGLIDEDFEEQLGSPSQVDEDEMQESEFHQIAKHRIIEVAGDDQYGRKVIIFSACRLPDRTEIDHNQLLQYLKHTLDQYVENDYSLVYFHHGLSSRNKVSFRWMVQAYQAFERKYKKNLKALYLVHPTNFIKFLWIVFKPIISVKFGKKVMYINYLHELRDHLHLDQLHIPERVKDYDAVMLEKNKPKQMEPTSIHYAPQNTQQFGMSLEFIKMKNNGEVIPRVMSESIAYVREHGLKTEGIFRRSANATLLKQVQQLFNEGKKVDYSHYSDVNIAAVVMKIFLRELPEPLMTFELYDYVIRIHTLHGEEKLDETNRLLCVELPEDNYTVLKYLISFLQEVVEHSEVNKMTVENLAIVFGPNLVWSRTQASLMAMGQINSFTKLLIANYERLFTR